jgi:ABC-type Na+ transport system ATPase subunit NatA
MNIDIRQITRSFGSFRALDDVSLNIREGELVALLGPCVNQWVQVPRLLFRKLLIVHLHRLLTLMQ